MLLKGIVPEVPSFESPPGIHIAIKQGKKKLLKYLKQHPFVYSIYDKDTMTYQSCEITRVMDKGDTIYVKFLR